MCGFVQGGSLSEQQQKHRIERDATVSEHYIEIALVVDQSMEDFYGSELQNYAFTLMNMVSMSLLLLRTYRKFPGPAG